jgi:hypothetical protein
MAPQIIPLKKHRFPGIQPNSGHRDYSRLSCGVADTAKYSILHALAASALISIRDAWLSLPGNDGLYNFGAHVAVSPLLR